MKAEELRIGNWVLYEQSSTEFIVKTISDSGLDVYNRTESTWIETNQFAGIPLTEEWLIKFGFTEELAPENINGVKHRLNIDDDGTTFFESIGTFKNDGHLVVLCVCRGNYFANNVHYLHDLQNLYFALTGNELTIKP